MRYQFYQSGTLYEVIFADSADSRYLLLYEAAGDGDALVRGLTIGEVRATYEAGEGMLASDYLTDFIRKVKEFFGAGESGFDAEAFIAEVEAQYSDRFPEEMLAPIDGTPRW